MKRALLWLGVGLLACGTLAGCKPDPLLEGDTVTPVMETRFWEAGRYNNFQVRLQAASSEGFNSRMLDFDSVPANANPRAAITFYNGERVIKTQNVTLSHRC